MDTKSVQTCVIFISMIALNVKPDVVKGGHAGHGGSYRKVLDSILNLFGHKVLSG